MNGGEPLRIGPADQLGNYTEEEIRDSLRHLREPLTLDQIEELRRDFRRQWPTGVYYPRRSLGGWLRRYTEKRP